MVLSKDLAERNEVIDFLHKAGCCRRCILRFLGEKIYSVYLSIDLVEKELINCEAGHSANNDSENSVADIIIDEMPSAKRTHHTPCLACLGLLEIDCDTVIPKILSAIKSSGFEYQTFLLQLSVPVVIELRHHVIFAYLKEFFKSVYADMNLDSIPSVKEAWKWIVGGHLGQAMKADFTPQSEFQISVHISYRDIEDECKILEEQCPQAFPNRRKKRATPELVYTRTAVLKALSALSEDEIKRLYPWPPTLPKSCCHYENIQCNHSPLYIAGRYNKYSRQLSQTPWIVDGEKKMETSVQELIVDVIQKRIHSDKIVFSASGREDVDVRMLGTGRPFVLELLNPRCIDWKKEDLAQMQNEINTSTSDVAVRDLQIVSKEDIGNLKEGEEEKKKAYSALCCVCEPLPDGALEKLQSIRDLTVKQKTPFRVLHRRPLAERERVIYKMIAEPIDKQIFRLLLTTQAGTYVKEFVHGDFGRTIPHLGSLLNTRTDIMELDVESVQLDWPPALE